MQTGQFQRAFYDYSSAVRLDDQNAKYFGNEHHILLKIYFISSEQRKLLAQFESN